MPDVHREKSAIDDGLHEAISAVAAGEKPWPMLLHGPAGTGKTCAALCLADQVCGSRYFVMREFARRSAAVVCGQLYTSIGYQIFPDKFWGEVKDAELTILDEIGSRERVSDHHYECLMEFLDGRRGKPAVYISNLPLETLAEVYDDRIASRLASGTVVQIDGVDRRLQR